MNVLRWKRHSKISIFNQIELWFPDTKELEPIGTASDMDGWTFIAQEKENLRQAIEFTTQGKSSTSIADVYEWPRGWLDLSMKAFLTTHAVTITALVAIGSSLLNRFRRGAATSENPIHNEIKIEPWTNQQTPSKTIQKVNTARNNKKVQLRISASSSDTDTESRKAKLKNRTTPRSFRIK